MSSTCNISYWLLIHTSGSCYQISAHRLEQQTNNCQSSHLLCETCTKEFPSSLVLIEADGVFPFHMRSEDLHVRETGRGPCYGSSNTEQWGAMNAIMLLQVFLQVLKKQWAMRLECLVLIIACLSAGFSRWVNTHDYAVNDLKRMFAVCLVCVRKKIVCHKCRGMLSNLKSNRENYAVCSLLLKLKDSYLTSFPSHVFVFYTDICFINTNLFCQTRTCLPVTLLIVCCAMRLHGEKSVVPRV